MDRPEPDLNDVNARVGGFLRDLAFIQTSKQKAWGFKGAAAAVLSLEESLDNLVLPDGTLPKIRGIGPASLRVVLEVLRTGESSLVEHAVEATGREADIRRRRSLRHHVMSRAAVRRVLQDPNLEGVSPSDYRGDFQMHSVWSDGSEQLEDLVEGCLARGYHYCAVTDHSHGLPIANGMSNDDVAAQHAEIDAINQRYGSRFRLLKGIEANIKADGTLDVTPEERAGFELVLAAPHSKLRRPEDQTERMLQAVATPGVHILAHPRGRIAGSRAGVIADWPQVFAAAALAGVAVEIDGDPSRQDLDYSLAQDALDAGCLFALDSDAHTVGQLRYADIAIAHARLAGVPADRIVNCWPLERLLAWLESLAIGGRVTPAAP